MTPTIQEILQCRFSKEEEELYQQLWDLQVESYHATQIDYSVQNHMNRLISHIRSPDRYWMFVYQQQITIKQDVNIC